MHWLKQKKVLFIALGVLFVVALFFFKTKSVFKNEAESGGLVYSGRETVADLVNKDSDADGIPDWEESLWGTDPTKKETTPGTPDAVAVGKIKSEEEKNDTADTGGADQNTENLTQTDKFSRELFATIATLNQAGEVDQTTVDKLSSSLAEKIQNSAPRKVFLPSDMKVTSDNSAQGVKTYYISLSAIYKKYPAKKTVLDVLQKFIIDDNNVDVSVLPELDPLIKQTNSIIDAMAKTNVPSDLAPLHLNVINELQKLSENVSDIRLFDTDVVVALAGISQYQKNTDDLQTATDALSNAISQKLNN